MLKIYGIQTRASFSCWMPDAKNIPLTLTLTEYVSANGGGHRQASDVPAQEVASPDALQRD